MRPKTHGKLKTLPSVKLFREDLEELLSLFRAYCETVTISDADSEYESLDELKLHVGSRVRNIEFAGTKPNITLTLMDHSRRVNMEWRLPIYDARSPRRCFVILDKESR
jgi:hypothetical protein